MKRRTRVVATLASVAVVSAAAVWFEVARKGSATEKRVVAGPPELDLSRWPAEFGSVLRAAQENARRSPESVASLSTLAMLYVANDFKTEAQAALRKLRGLDPTNPRWPYLLATLLEGTEARAEMEASLQDTLRLAPDYAPAAVRLAQHWSRNGREPDARALYEQQLAKNPSDLLATLGLVDLERRMGDTNGAIKSLQELLAARPSATEARLLLAELLDSAGRTTEAAHVRQAVEQTAVATPTADSWLQELERLSYDPFRLQTLGMLRLNSSDAQAAVPLLEKAARLAPQDPDLSDAYAQALVAAERTADARRVAEAALQRMPDAAVLRVRLANILVEEQQPEAAEKVLVEGLQRQPERAEIHDALGRLLYRARRFDEAVAAFREALRLDPVLADTQLYLGRALGAAGHRDEAKQAIATAVAMRPTNTEAVALLCELEFEDGRVAEAERLATTLIQQAPEFETAQRLFEQVTQRRANLALAESGTSAAERIFLEALSVAPALGALHGDYGALLAKQQRLVEARAAFEQYAKLAPNDARAWLFLGTALKQLNDPAGAITAFQRGLTAAQASGDTRRIKLLNDALGRP